MKVSEIVFIYTRSTNILDINFSYILQWTRRDNFCSLTFSYIFEVFQSHINFYSFYIELSGDVEKYP